MQHNPFDSHRFACATSANYGIYGQGKVFILDRQKSILNGSRGKNNLPETTHVTQM